MSTSDRTLVLEAAAAAALVVGAVAVAAPGDVWLPDLGLHPVWLPVILLAARYGPRGLFTSLAVTWGALIATSVVLGGTLDGFALRLQGASDLFALLTATLVAWIGMLHESRMSGALARLAESTLLQQQSEVTVGALHDGLTYLRTRHDRLDISLSLWRNLASRIERGVDVDAADAVLELCEVRTGAQAGVVQLRDGNRLSTVAWRGQGSTASTRPRDIAVDATVRAAILARHVTAAGPGATERDSDVAAPVLDDGSGVVIGVIALRGVAPGSLRAADLRDLAVIAQWLAPGLARSLQAAVQRKRTGEQRKLIGERSS